MSSHKKHNPQGASADTPPGSDSHETQPSGQAAAPSGHEEQILQETTVTEPFEQLQQELEQSRAKAAENFEGWQRERADFMNYKKRIERDQAQSLQNISGNIIKKYLVIIDDLERALKNRPHNGEDAAWAEGIELIYRKLQNILESEGVKPIPAEGQFDPTVHEAVTHEENPDYASGQVIEVLQQGYTLGDRVLRPALVRVAR